MWIEGNTKIADRGIQEVKIMDDELVDRCMEDMIGKLGMMNSVLEGFKTPHSRQPALPDYPMDDIQ